MDGQEERRPNSQVLVLRDADQVICVAQQGGRVKSGFASQQPQVMEGGAVVVEDGVITRVALTSSDTWIPAGAQIIDAAGKIVLPGFIDCHTIEPHLGAAESPRGSVDGFLNKIAM